jgi:probable DNA metabolism protein
MKNKRIYICENSVEGIFTGIYDAWSSRYGHENNRIEVHMELESGRNLELFSEYIYVNTDQEKADKVAKAVKEKISMEAYDMVCHGVWSDKADKADIIYRFLILGFSMGARVVNHLGNDIVMSLFEMNRNVSNESHHYLGFLRFKEISNHILLANINPKNDILRLIAPHFSDRLSNENFLIYDENRKTCIIHKVSYPWIYTMGDTINLDSILEFSEEEEKFQCLWKTFFETIGIDERRNDKLQRNNLPLRFRNNMIEFKKS